MTLKFQLKSGKKLEIDIAPVELGLELYRSILIECRNADLDISIATEDTLMTILMKNKEAILKILSSKLVYDATLDCCSRVIYNKQKFNMELFEKVENRKDLFDILMIVAMENIRPFFAEPHIILDALQVQFLP